MTPERLESLVRQQKATPPPVLPTWYELLDERQIKEVEFARTYARDFHHGTDGHSRLMLIADLAAMLDVCAVQTPPEDDVP